MRGQRPILIFAAINVCMVAGPARAVDFDRDIRPILLARCFSCHGPVKQRSGLRLDRMSDAVRGGESGPALVPGNSKESLLIRKVTDDQPQIRMPPKGDPLTPAQIDALRTWIDEGAKTPPEDERTKLPGADNW